MGQVAEDLVRRNVAWMKRAGVAVLAFVAVGALATLGIVVHGFDTREAKAQKQRNSLDAALSKANSNVAALTFEVDALKAQLSALGQTPVQVTVQSPKTGTANAPATIIIQSTPTTAGPTSTTTTTSPKAPSSTTTTTSCLRLDGLDCFR